MTYLCGRFLGALLAFFLIVNVFGISVAQVVACSSDAYYWHTHLDKRYNDDSQSAAEPEPAYAMTQPIFVSSTVLVKLKQVYGWLHQRGLRRLFAGHQLDICCRTWALIFGAILQLSVLVPTLRHTRVINILGLIGTTYTVWWIVIAAGHSGRGIQHPDATA